MINFYEVDLNYINFLKQMEQQARGKTFVPNIEYSSGHNKFLCGIIWEEPKSHIPYFVALSSYVVQRSENILIVIPEDVQRPIKGSLRFNYMIPVPQQALTFKDFSKEQDIGYRKLLQKELAFVRHNAGIIFNKAQEVYSLIADRTGSQRLIENSCDFKLLEQAYIAYSMQHGYPLPQQQSVASRLAAAQRKTQPPTR